MPREKKPINADLKFFDMKRAAYIENIAWAIGGSVATSCAFIATESFWSLVCYFPALLVTNKDRYI